MQKSAIVARTSDIPELNVMI